MSAAPLVCCRPARPLRLVRLVRRLYGVSLVGIGLILVLGTVAGAVAQAQSAAARAAVAQSTLTTGAILQGIVSYTSWPQRPSTLGLCINRSATDAQEIARQLQPLLEGRQLKVHLIEANQALPPHCHAVYLEGWQPQPLHQLLRSLAQQPVLTLGNGPEFCSNGGMFCLEERDGRTRFEVNLDAVARSGLRVHPHVLRLATPQGRKP